MASSWKATKMAASGTTLLIETEPIPLATGPDGVARVGGTRVTLDALVAAFYELLPLRRSYTSIRPWIWMMCRP